MWEEVYGNMGGGQGIRYVQECGRKGTSVGGGSREKERSRCVGGGDQGRGRGPGVWGDQGRGRIQGVCGDQGRGRGPGVRLMALKCDSDYYLSPTPPLPSPPGLCVWVISRQQDISDF